MYAVSGCPHVSGTTFPSASRRMVIGHVGTGAAAFSGSTLPCVGQWYSIFIAYRSTRSRRQRMPHDIGAIASLRDQVRRDRTVLLLGEEFEQGPMELRARVRGEVVAGHA